MSWWLTVLALAASAAAAAPPAGAERPRTHYVSPSGDDAAPGTSPRRPWRTVRRVNRARLRPGDRVLFRGGATFGDAALDPRRSGRPGARIGFGSYGTGVANLPRGIFLDHSHLLFTRLMVDGGGVTKAGVASSSQSPVAGIVVRAMTIRNVAIGVLSPKTSDRGWTIAGNRISGTGDSGVIALGSGFVVSSNTIVDTGRDPAITYNKHGIYAKGRGMRVTGNEISRFEANGVSTRERDATILDNTISGGPIGIAYFKGRTSGGTTLIVGNRIRDVTNAGIFVDEGADQAFLMAGNTIAGTMETGLNVKRVTTLVLVNNLVAGTFRYAFAAQAPTRAFRQHHNLWFDSARSPAFLWDGRVHDADAQREASGAGEHDVVADPRLDAQLVPAPDSPAVDAGTRDVSPLLRYRRRCTSRPLRYCGPAPDIGAVEVQPAR